MYPECIYITNKVAQNPNIRIGLIGTKDQMQMVKDELKGSSAHQTENSVTVHRPGEFSEPTVKLIKCEEFEPHLFDIVVNLEEITL